MHFDVAFDRYLTPSRPLAIFSIGDRRSALLVSDVLAGRKAQSGCGRRSHILYTLSAVVNEAPFRRPIRYGGGPPGPKRPSAR